MLYKRVKHDCKANASKTVVATSPFDGKWTVYMHKQFLDEQGRMREAWDGCKVDKCPFCNKVLQ